MAYWAGDNKKTTLITLGFNPGFLARSVSENIGSDSLELHPQFPTFDPLIHQIGLALKAELEQNPQGSRLYAESAATFLATHLLHRYASRKSTPHDARGGLPKHKLQLVIDYIYANLDRNLGLSDLAELAQMSPYHFSRLFKQSTGHSPYQFVIKCRVERAREMLLNSDLSIAEITYTVGACESVAPEQSFQADAGSNAQDGSTKIARTCKTKQKYAIPKFVRSLHWKQQDLDTEVTNERKLCLQWHWVRTL